MFVFKVLFFVIPILIGSYRADFASEVQQILSNSTCQNVTKSMRQFNINQVNPRKES
jgi:hypothetical protein